MSWFKNIFGGEDAPLRTESFAGFPFPVVAVSGAKAEREWQRLRSLWKNEGASPVVIGDKADVEQLAKSIQHNEEQSTAALLQAAQSLDVKKYFASRRAQVSEDGETIEEGEWPEESLPKIELGVHCDLRTQVPKPTVYLARIPTARSWEIPAHLKFGAWNACPAAEEHTAVLHHWCEKYGAEIFGVQADIIECTVARPPQTQEAAMTLAREQYYYCSDIVDQGVESVAALGNTLLHGKAWYFWWD